LGAGRAAGVGAIGLGAIGFFVYLMMRMGTPDMAMLYSGLDAEDAGHIVSILDQKGVPYTLKANGSQILVPAPEVPAMRLALAQAGLPRGGAVGYEIFDKADALGSSNFVRDINRLRALEGELARTIQQIDGIRTARVHLVLPRRELFSREQQEPSASIALGLRGATRLAPQQVAAIQNLVAAAVPGLKVSRISIIDDHGTLLARASGDGSDGLLSPLSADERRRAYEDQIRRKVIEILEPIVGPDRVRAEVTADMDFDRLTTNSEEYDPNTQVVRSTQTVTENSSNNETQPGQQAVSVASNIPNATQPQSQQSGQRNNSSTARNEETTNYEISKTVKSYVRETGALKRLSVAVMVDGTYTTDAAGKRTYQPIGKAEIDKLTAMVRSAVGYQEKRGDRIELINMRFSAPDDSAQADAKQSFLSQFSPADLFRAAELVVLAFVAILVILLVIRPLMKRLFEVKPLPVVAGGQPGQAMLPNQSGATAALTGPDGQPGEVHAVDDDGNAIDIGQVEGRVRHSSVKKVGQIVEKHPEEAVAILRSWMVQES
jgi:flagellar M-ring protein FliF